MRVWRTSVIRGMRHASLARIFLNLDFSLLIQGILGVSHDLFGFFEEFSFSNSGL
ncbi:MAG TPA: hypothetical protein VGF38_01910 [Ktedonobacterales bacterium]